MNEELAKKIVEIKKIFMDNFDNDSLLQVGSSVKNNNYHDIDFLVISNDKNKTINNIYEIFKDYKTSMIDDSLKVSNYFDKEISFAIYERDYFFNLVHNYNKGEQMHSYHKSWATGYWLIEGFINDLKNSMIVVDNHNLNELIKIVSKESIYGEKRILVDCKEELIIKKNILDKVDNPIEISLVSNDLLLCSLRALSLINGKPLRSFKNIKDKIEDLPDEYKTIINNLVDNNINKVIEIIDNKIDRVNNLYMGTWQFNGSFKPLTQNEIIDLLNFAKEKGIINYDTALAYKNVEDYISKSNCKDEVILTKIPAITKPKLDEDCNINDYYPKEYIYNCLNKSLNNLNRDYVDILLLHNWNYNWDKNKEIIKWLLELKRDNFVKKIGISLPNNYNRRLSDNILYDIDVVEAPYNNENKWIENDIDYYKRFNIEIILRSLFLQGKMLKDRKYEEIINNAKKYDTSLVIGMTTIDQIENNINCVRGDNNGWKEKRNKYKL